MSAGGELVGLPGFKIKTWGSQFLCLGEPGN